MNSVATAEAADRAERAEIVIAALPKAALAQQTFLGEPELVQYTCRSIVSHRHVGLDPEPHSPSRQTKGLASVVFVGIGISPTKPTKPGPSAQALLVGSGGGI